MLGVGSNPLKAMQTGILSSGYEKYCTSCLLVLKVSRVIFVPPGLWNWHNLTCTFQCWVLLNCFCRQLHVTDRFVISMLLHVHVCSLCCWCKLDWDENKPWQLYSQGKVRWSFFGMQFLCKIKLLLLFCLQMFEQLCNDLADVHPAVLFATFLFGTLGFLYFFWSLTVSMH